MKNPIIPLIGRIFLVLVFIPSLIGKLTNFSGTVGFMESTGMPIASILLVVAIIFELVGSLSLILGIKAKLGALILIIFLIPTTLIFHLDFSSQDQIGHLLKNIAIIGGLLLIIYSGPGRYSLSK